MKMFLSGVGAAVIVMSLLASGYLARSAPRVQQVGPIKLSDLQLNRSFQMTTQSGQLNTQFPPSAGVAITQVYTHQAPIDSVRVSVNGTLVAARNSGPEREWLL